jgi:hypothetical protein
MANRKSFPAKVTSLGAVERFVREQAVEAGLPDDERDRLAESVSEAVGASLGDPAPAMLDVRIRVTRDTIEIVTNRPGEPLPAAQIVGSFAEWLSQLLMRRGLSPEAAARRIGVSLKTVSRWVRGETEPRYRELGLIQQAFGEQPLSVR